MNMRRAVNVVASVLLACCVFAQPAEAAEVTGKKQEFAAETPVVSWTFEGARESGAVQPASERIDALQGALEAVPGVSGSGLKFDNSAFESLGYDKNQRAYSLSHNGQGKPAGSLTKRG